MKSSINYQLTSAMSMELDDLRPEAVLDLMQSAGSINASLHKLGMKELIEQGYAWVLNRIKYQKVGKVKKETSVRVLTWPNPKKRIEYPRQFKIYNQDNEECYIASSIWLLIDLKEHKIIRTDAVDLGDQEDPIIFDFPRIRVDYSLFKEIGSYQVDSNDIDVIGHMNNTKYAKVIYKFYPFIYKELQIDYIKEIQSNAVITVKEYRDNDDIYVAGFIGDEVHFISKFKKEDE